MEVPLILKFSGNPTNFDPGIPLKLAEIPLILMELVECSRISIPLKINGNSTFLEKSDGMINRFQSGYR